MIIRKASAILLTLLATNPLCADLNPGDEPLFNCRVNFLADYFSTKPGKLQDDSTQRLRYACGVAAASRTFVRYTKTSLRIGPIYTHNTIHWTDNPYFVQRQFPEGGFFLMLDTEYVPRWNIRVATSYQVQRTDFINFGQYGMVRALVWARYHWFSNFGVHIGYVIERGRRDTFVRPIFGFDYWPCRPIRITAVYPSNISVYLFLAENFYIQAAARLIRSRVRLSQQEPLPKGIVEYRSFGGDIRVGYWFGRCFGIEAYIGMTFDGFLRVCNRGGSSIEFHHLLGTPLAGARILGRF